MSPRRLVEIVLIALGTLALVALVVYWLLFSAWIVCFFPFVDC